MRALGIDYGSKRIGVALGDTESRIASPWEVVEFESREEALARIREIAALEDAKLIVVGIPRPLKDTALKNEQVEEIRNFIEDLKSAGLEVEEEDETLTSRLAAVQVRDRGERGKRDDLAAAAILQAWLDRYVSP